MNPRVASVSVLKDYRLELEFDNSEVREFDVSPYVNIGVFKELKDYTYFSRVKVSMGTIEWPNGQDLCPDMLYEESVPFGSVRNGTKLSNLFDAGNPL